MDRRRELIRHSFHPRFVLGTRLPRPAENGRRRCPRPPMGADLPLAYSLRSRISPPIGPLGGERQVGGGESQDGRELGLRLPVLLPLPAREISGIRIERAPTGPRPTLLRIKTLLRAPRTSFGAVLSHSGQWGIVLSVRGGIRGALRGAKYRPLLRHAGAMGTGVRRGGRPQDVRREGVRVAGTMCLLSIFL